MKCDICKYSDIIPVVLYDTEVQKCTKCNYIVLKLEKMSSFVKLIAFIENIGNFRSNAFSIDEMDEINRGRLEKFFEMLDFNGIVRSGEGVSVDVICNICKDPLKAYVLENGKTFLYCEYCGSVYIDYDDFKKYVSYVQEKIERDSNMKCRIRKTLSRIIGFFMFNRGK